VNQQNDFVMTHGLSLWLKLPPASDGVQQGQTQDYSAFAGNPL
jgi:hypothetical protein